MMRASRLALVLGLFLFGLSLARAGLDVGPADTSMFATKSDVTTQVTSTGVKRITNTAIPAGNTVTAQSETQFSTKAALPAAALATSGTRGSIFLFGLYSSQGVTPSITPRVRIAGVLMLPARQITGLLASTNVPWYARVDFLVTDSGIVASGVLTIDDNQIRIFGGSPITGVDLQQSVDITASAQWGQASCSITLQGFSVEYMKP